MRGNHKVLKIKRKALTDLFCVRPEMTPGTLPRIIFLLVAPAACSAERDTQVRGGQKHWWTRGEGQDSSTQEAACCRFLRFMEEMPLPVFPAKHTLCVTHVQTSRSPSERSGAPDQYRHQGTTRPSSPNFF